jgi:hypothetical protein
MGKTQVYLYFSTYGSHKHDVLVIQVGGKPYDTMMNSHKMLDMHDRELGSNFFEHLAPYLNDNFTISFIESPKPKSV